MNENLQKAARDGAFWTALSQAGAGLCQFVQLFWLARLLPAEDFGVMAIAQASVGILAPMTDLGLAQAIIQQKTIEKRQLDTLFWINMAIGVAFFTAFLGIGWGAARFYARPELWPLMVAVAVIFLLYPLAAQPSAMLTRSLDFRSLAISDVVSWLFSLFFAVFLAKKGWGVFALGAAHVIRYAVVTVISWWLARKICPLPGRGFDWKTSRPLVRFGLFDSGARWANILQNNLDKFIVGKWFGMADLGVYSLAWSIVQAPMTRLLPIISKVTGPIFSKIQQKDGAAIERAYHRVFMVSCMVSVPIFLSISLISNELVILFFGNKWLAAAPVVAVLSLAALVRSPGQTGAGLLLARGRAEPGLWWNVGFGIFMNLWLVLFIAFRPDPLAAAWAQFTGVAMTFWIWHWLISRFGGVGYGPVRRDLLTVFAIGGLVSVAVFGAGQFGLSPLFSFFLKSMIAAAGWFFLFKKSGLLKKYF